MRMKINFELHSLICNFEAVNSGITHIILPDGYQDCRLPFYLAVEEWVARNLEPREYFFTWRVRPTVIFGRNQKIDAEVSTAYCSAHGIEVYRRRSGGGCVYADKDNLMMSYITPRTDVATTFRSYTESVASMLRSLGLDAEASGRNDITVDGRKVSGNAFYHIPGRSIVHGTMLYSTNLDHMLNAITPARSKLADKHVQSVQSRITTLDRYLTDMTIDEFNDYAISHITDSKIALDAEQIAEIGKIEQTYYEPAWIYGHRSGVTVTRSRRFEGVGQIDAEITLDGGVIADINLTGDYFLLSDLDSTLLSCLRGLPLDAPAIAGALSSIEVSEIILGLENKQLLSLLTD